MWLTCVVPTVNAKLQADLDRELEGFDSFDAADTQVCYLYALLHEI